MQVNFDWYVSGDIHFYGSDYSYFANAIVMVDVNRREVVDVWFRSLAVADCDGNDVFYAPRSELTSENNVQSNFFYDVVKHYVIKDNSDDILDAYDYMFMKNIMNGSKSPYGK